MRKLVAGFAFMVIMTAGGASIAQDVQDDQAKPSPAQCYPPCASQYNNATDRILCISQCCGC